MYSDTGTDFYATDTYGTDPYGAPVDLGSWEDPGTAAGCCCSDVAAPADLGTTGWELPPEPPAPSYEPTYEPVYEPAAVMPAGQPGGPVVDTTYDPASQASAVMPAGQPGGLTAVQPASNPWEISSADFVSVQTSPVAPAPWEISSSDFVPVETTIPSTAGGRQPWEISSSDFGGGDAASILSGSTTVIGPPPAGSLPDSLSQVHGLAGANGDLLTQIQVTRISDSVHRMNSHWW